MHSTMCPAQSHIPCRRHRGRLYGNCFRNLLHGITQRARSRWVILEHMVAVLERIILEARRTQAVRSRNALVWRLIYFFQSRSATACELKGQGEAGDDGILSLWSIASFAGARGPQSQHNDAGRVGGIM